MSPPGVGGAHLDGVRKELDLGFVDLWFLYVSVGGSRSLPRLVGHLSDGDTWPLMEHVYVVVALNDRFQDLGMGQPLRYPDQPEA